MQLTAKYEVGFREYRRQHLYTALGNEYPSVTKILGIIDKSGPLIIWARREALKLAKTELLKAIELGTPIDGAHLDEVLGRADKQPDKLKDEAADIGSKVHNAIDAYILGQEPILDDQSRPGFENFLKWLDTAGIKIIKGDTPVASILYGFGGRLDAVGTKGDKIVVLDWKTSNRIYDPYALQVAAYAQALRETYGVDVECGYVVRFGKEVPGDIEAKEVNLHDAWQAFESAIELTKNLKGDLWE